MAERQQAGVAEQQVEADGVEPEDQDVDRECLVRHDQRKHDEQQDRGADAMSRHEVEGGTCRHGGHDINPALPKKPCGLTSSTTAISTKIDRSAKYGANSDVML